MRFGLLMAAMATFLLVLAGCGGAGGGSSAIGAGFKLSIQWPTSGRHIPSLATRIHLNIDQAGVTVPGGDLDVLKPAEGNVSVVTLTNLPVAIPLGFHARAYTSQGTGSEVLLGTVDSTVSLVQGMANVVILDLESTVDHLSATNADFEAGVLTVAPGKDSELMVEGHAAGQENGLIPLDPTKLRFTASGAGFSVTADGLVHGTAFGTGSINVTDLDSGRSIDVPVSIKSPVRTLEVGVAGKIEIINHQTLVIKPLIKALDKNGNPVTNAVFNYAITGGGLTVDSGAGTIIADEGTVFANGEIETGTLTVSVADSTLSQQANISVLAHGGASNLVLGPASFDTKIEFNVISNFISTNIATTSTADDGDFEVQSFDALGNQIPIADGDLSFSLVGGNPARYKLTQVTGGVHLEVKTLDKTASTTLVVKDKTTGVKLNIAVTTTGIV